MVIYFILIFLEFGEEFEGVYKNGNGEGWNLGVILLVRFFFFLSEKGI